MVLSSFVLHVHHTTTEEVFTVFKFIATFIYVD
jgi:hypothetical protein